MNVVAQFINTISGYPNAREWTTEEKLARGFKPTDCCGPCGEYVECSGVHLNSLKEDK